MNKGKRGKLITKLMVIICLAVLPITVFAGTNQKEIQEAFYVYCEKELGYCKDEVMPYNIAQSEDGTWIISLLVKNPDPETNGLILGQLDKDGGLISIQGPTAVSLKQQFGDAFAKASWHYQDMYRFKREWEARLDSMTDEEIKEFVDMGRESYIIDFLHHTVVLPDETCIPYEEARGKAIEAIEALEGWTKQMTDYIDVTMEIVHIPVGRSQPVYQFVYTYISDVYYAKAIESGAPYTDQISREYHRLSDAEDKVFGNNLPRMISVRIDAKTGELVGDVYVELTTSPTETPYMKVTLWE